MVHSNRRDFLKQSVAAGAAFAIGGTKSSGNVLGANDTIRVAVAGIHGRGQSHIGELLAIPGVEIAYLIDPDQRIWDARAKTIEDKTGKRPKLVKDAREALEDKELNALTVATPNHWHTLLTVWGCQAGKDVYVEKPCSHNVHEGRVAVEAARKYNRIVQHGTQNRTSGGWAKVIAAIKSGKLGKLNVSRGLCYKPRGSIGFQKPSDPPKELDFNIWLGPAQEQPYHGNLVHYNWHWFWDMGNGDIGNQGVHQMDVARWAIEGATLPKSVIGLGGRFGYEDQGETANTQITFMDYGDTQLIFEVRGLTTEPFHGQKVGNIFHLDEGTIAGTTFYPKGSDKPAPLPEVEVKLGPGGGHMANFIEAVKSRKQSDLNADILEGHYSSALCHLANVSYRLGEKVPFNPKTKALGDDKEAYETLERMEQHLANDAKLQLDGLQYQLGRKLTVDAASERFTGDEQANKMLFREYRKGFEVPERIA